MDQRSSKLWKLSISAKAEGIVTAELQVASPGAAEKKGLFSFLRKMKTKTSFKQQSQGVINCDASLQLRARIFFFKVKVAAGRLRELRLHLMKQRHGRPLLHFTSSAGKGSLPAPVIPSSFQFFKSSTCSPSSQRAPSFLSKILFSNKQRKESLLVCGAGVGAFAVFLLHHASSWATHFPALALNAGSRLVGLLATFVHKKCESAGLKGAACFLQGARAAMTLLRMVMSMVRPTFGGGRLVNTALLAILIGVVLTGKASKLQDFLDRKTQGRARFFKAQVAMKLLLVMQLIKRFWVHIGMKQACLFMLLLAFLTSAAAGLEELN